MHTDQQSDSTVNIEKTLGKWRELVEQSDDLTIFDTAAITRAFGNWTAQILSDPAKLAAAQQELWQEYMSLWEDRGRKMLGQDAESAPVSDRRFKDKAWEEEATFDYLKRNSTGDRGGWIGRIGWRSTATVGWQPGFRATVCK